MLQDLHIENIAVIERADICFTEGFNVLTGETGAGKSIIIDALQSVLGARTSRELVRAGEEKALASAVFVTACADEWLSDNDIDSEEELILQRRINEDGKTSARVCGTPVTATQLRELAGLLLDIHGQNDGRQLMDENRHRDYLDAFGEYGDILTQFSEAYAHFSETRREIKRLAMDENEKARLADSLRSMIEDLEKAELKIGEEEELTDRRNLLHNGEKLTEVIDSAYTALYGGKENAVSLVQDASNSTERGMAWCKELEAVTKTLDDAGFMLKDAAETLSDISRGLDFSSEEFDRIETRLSVLRRLSKKYGGDTEELLKKSEDAKNRLDELDYADDRLRKLELRLEKEREETLTAAENLTRVRKSAALLLEKRIVEELMDLSMPSARFSVDIIPIENKNGFDTTGGDEIRFFMSANKGERAGAINKIASGGELSRIMLAMKNVFSERDAVETLVFDEVDTGVSGIAAQRVGEKLAELSKTKQVLCVTHLPQIAAMADTHFLIEKAEKDGRTFTNVTELDKAGRAREIARLYGGDNITENTLKSAEEQIQAAANYKKNIRKKA